MPTKEATDSTVDVDAPERLVAPDPPTGSNTTLEYFDGFDDYATADIPFYWEFICSNPYRLSSAVPSGVVIQSGAGGRNNTPRVRFNNPSGWGLYKAGRLGSIPTRTVGCALLINSIFIMDFPYLITFFDGLKSQLALVVNESNGTGALEVVEIDYPAGTKGRVILPETTRTLTPLTWYYIEMSVTFSSTNGEVTVRVNNEDWLSGTGLNTVNTGCNPSSDGVAIGMDVMFPTTLLEIDDFYMRGDDIFCGKNTRVLVQFPSGDGSNSEWQRAGTINHGANWMQLADATPDGDTSMVKSTAFGEVDEYTYDPINLQGKIHAVMNCLVSKTDLKGGVELTPMFTSSGTIYPGNPHVIDTGNQWLGVVDIQGFDPFTGEQWTLAAAGASRMGVRRTSG